MILLMINFLVGKAWLTICGPIQSYRVQEEAKSEGGKLIIDCLKMALVIS